MVSNTNSLHATQEPSDEMLLAELDASAKQVRDLG